MCSLFQRQIGEHRARARGHQQGYVMSVDDLSAFDHQRDVVGANLDHRFPGRGQSKQRRQRSPLSVHSAIGQQNESGSFGRGRLYVLLQSGKSGLRFLYSVLGREREDDFFCVAQFFLQQLQLPAVEQRRVEGSRTEKYFQRHHMTLTERINRGIGDLSETLLAIVPKRPAESGQRSRRRIITHAPDRLLALFHQRLKQQAVLIFTPAQRCHGLLWLRRRTQKWLVGRSHQHGRLRRDDADSLAQPQRIHGTNKLAALRIDQQYLSRPQPLSFDDVFALQIGNSHLRANHQQTVRGQGVTQGTETVAVKFRADRATVGEDQRRRTVPRLLQAGLLLQKVPQLGRGLRRTLPGRRHHRKHGFGRGIVAAQKKFEAVI